MKLLSNFVKSIAALFVFVGAATSAANADSSTSLVGVQGYDLVSYQSGKPVRGAGTNTFEVDGVVYQFATKENLKKFKANPAKYLPAYGGYCAFGVSKGKKFIGDPNVWKVVDGTLYLNLNKDVQRIWEEDVPGNITEANGQWKSIANVPAAQL